MRRAPPRPRARARVALASRRPTACVLTRATAAPPRACPLALSPPRHSHGATRAVRRRDTLSPPPRRRAYAKKRKASEASEAAEQAKLAEANAAAQAAQAKAGEAASSADVDVGSASSSSGAEASGRAASRKRSTPPDANSSGGAEGRIDAKEAIERVAQFHQQHSAFGVHDAERLANQRQTRPKISGGASDAGHEARVLAEVRKANSAILTTAAPHEHFPKAWPAFPLARDAERIQDAGLVMEARVVDFLYQGCHRSTQVRDYLHAVGFDIADVDRSASQYLCTCGIVSAAASTMLFGAQDWRTVDVRNAVSDEYTRFANSACKLFTPGEINGTSKLREGASQLRGRPPARYLLGQEVAEVTQALWAREWAAAVRKHEPCGPPCARCDENHPTKHCPHLSQPPMPNVSDWHETASLDACLAGVVRDVMYVRATGGERMRIVSCSDDFTTGRGNHWFTVVYSVRKAQGGGDSGNAALGGGLRGGGKRRKGE